MRVSVRLVPLAGDRDIGSSLLARQDGVDWDWSGIGDGGPETGDWDWDWDWTGRLEWTWDVGLCV